MPDTWEALEHDCKNCRECSLWETRTNVVFGVGNQNAEVLFIGEGPGANEDAQGVPFVGRAGHLLDDMLEIIGLKRDDVYIANIVKCRPPQNRDPLPTESEAGKPRPARRGAGRLHRLSSPSGRAAAAQDYCLSRTHRGHAHHQA